MLVEVYFVKPIMVAQGFKALKRLRGNAHVHGERYVGFRNSEFRVKYRTNPIGLPTKQHGAVSHRNVYAAYHGYRTREQKEAVINANVIDGHANK